MDNNQKEVSKNLGILARSSAVVFVGIFLSKLFIYLYRIIIARYYGPEAYGIFSLAVMVLGFFVAFAGLGLGDGLTRFVPIYRAKDEREKISYLIKASQKFLLISGILAAIILWISSGFIAINIFHNAELSIFLKIFAVLIPINLLANFYFLLIRSYERIDADSFGSNILQNMSKLIFLGIFVTIGLKSVESMAFSYFLGIFISLIFAYLYGRIELSKKFEKRISLSAPEKKYIISSVLKYSWPLIVFGIIGSLMFWIDSILIGYFKNVYWVGIYNAVIPIAALLVISQEIFIKMFFPMITRELYSEKKMVATELSKQVVKWVWIINMPLLVLILLFPGVFINFLFGAEYLFAINALRILAFGQFIYSIAAVSNNLLLSVGRSKTVLTNLIIVGVINFMLNYFLIPIYGINGAAFSTALSFMILSTLIIFESYYFTRIFPFRRKLINVFISAIIPAAVLMWVSNFLDVNTFLLILLGISFGMFYLILIFLTKALDRNDLELLGKIYKKFFKHSH